VLARRGVEHRLQVRMHRNRERLASLLLFHCEHAVADVLATHPHHIAAPLPGVEQQRERKARLRADQKMRLELCNFKSGAPRFKRRCSKTTTPSSGRTCRCSSKIVFLFLIPSERRWRTKSIVTVLSSY
jgi:hypothetical protein